ncbi:MAG: VOC family protein [Bacteroidetes bacterium]|nr:VOC family protein [Bacteroidota bacterium]
MKKITPFLWFDNNAEEAANFYVSIFKNSKIKSLLRYGKDAAMPEGTVLTVSFELDGREYVALNGGSYYKLNSAFSLAVECENQQEIDYYWDKLTDGGKPIQCGWLEDKYGLTWQVAPHNISELLMTPDPAKNKRVMDAMMKMIKLDIKALEEA